MVKEINLKSSSNKEFFLIHGYTGSTTDFGTLPYYLHKKFKVNVRVPLLKGHGTKIQDLDNLQCNDFIEQIEDLLVKDLKKGKKIIIIGVSFGAQIALYLAGKYKMRGVISVSPPYRFRFPLNIPGIETFGNIIRKKYWKKPLYRDELVRRKRAGNVFYYDQMHRYGLKITREINEQLDKILNKIECPILIIFSKKERLGHYKSIELLTKEVKSKIKRVLFYKEKNHNLFYSSIEKKIEKDIAKFVEKEELFKK